MLVDTSVWIDYFNGYASPQAGILAQTGHLPTAENTASMLNLDQLTGSGSRLNPKKYSATATSRQDTLTRTQGRMTNLDAPTVKRKSELEGWGMGP